MTDYLKTPDQHLMKSCKLTMHIGMHKTGSTAIQSALYQNAKILSTFGHAYPKRGTQWRGHHPIAWASGAPHPSQNTDIDVNKLLDNYLEGSAGKNLILSSEDFYRVPSPPDSDPIRRVTVATESTDVICYIRHPLSWVLSSYKWHVKKDPNRFESISAFLKCASLSGWFQFPTILDRWNQIPKATVIARLYSDDIVNDFTGLLGIPKPLPHKRSNTSIRSLSALICSILAHHTCLSIDTRFMQLLDNEVRRLTEMDISLLSNRQCERIMEIAEAPLLELFRKFPFDGMTTLLNNNHTPNLMSNEEVIQVTASVLNTLGIRAQETNVIQNVRLGLKS